MNTYLTIMVTILVLTQIVRIIQNTIQLRRQYKLFQAQLGQLDDITQEDLDMQRRAYDLLADLFVLDIFCIHISASFDKHNHRKGGIANAIPP